MRASGAHPNSANGNGRPSGDRVKFTPPQVARSWGIKPDKVRSWILCGELPAINVATNQNGRARYLIDADDLRDFELRRAVTAPVNGGRGKRKDNGNGNVIEFFK